MMMGISLKGCEEIVFDAGDPKRIRSIKNLRLMSDDCELEYHGTLTFANAYLEDDGTITCYHDSSFDSGNTYFTITIEE